MLFGAVTVVVVIASSDPNDGSTEAMKRALHAALGEDSTVIVRNKTEVDPDDVLSKGGKDSVVGVVTWSERQRHVLLKFALGERRGEREIRFDATDAPVERGRTVGFALASMVPDALLASRTPTAPPQAVASTTPATPVPPAPPPSAGETRGASESRTEPPREPDASRARISREVLAIDLAALGMVGIGGAGGGVGGGAGVRLPLGRGFAVRFGASARVGEIAEAKATSRVLGGAGGIGWQFFPTASHRITLGARAEALVLVQTVIHFSSDDPEPVAGSRVVPGLGARLEGTVHLVEHAAFLVGTGPEVALGTTDILVAGGRVATLPPVRLGVEAGLRVSF